MNARKMGRFIGEFLEGLAGTKDAVDEAAPVAPIVVPVDTVREAVTPMIKQIVIEMLQQAMAEEETPGPTGQQLDMMFADAGREGAGDPIAEATLRRVHEINERQAQRDREAAQGEAVPPTYDPNDPGSGKPWTAPNAAPPNVA